MAGTDELLTTASPSDGAFLFSYPFLHRSPFQSGYESLQTRHQATPGLLHETNSAPNIEVPVASTRVRVRILCGPSVLF